MLRTPTQSTFRRAAWRGGDELVTSVRISRRGGIERTVAAACVGMSVALGIRAHAGRHANPSKVGSDNGRRFGSDAAASDEFDGALLLGGDTSADFDEIRIMGACSQPVKLKY
ncbi:hypothetical protein JOE11_001837 [Robbsia andropogonis]